MSRDFDGAGSGSVQNFYYHQDDLFNVIALTAGIGGVSIPVEEGQPLPFAAGAIVERVVYGDHGTPDLRTATGGKAGTASIARNAYLFTGRDWDHEVRFYHYRTRYMEPTWGRFTTRDTIGIWGDIANRGNGYEYVGGGPLHHTDAFGEKRSRMESPVKKKRDNSKNKKHPHTRHNKPNKTPTATPPQNNQPAASPAQNTQKSKGRNFRFEKGGGLFDRIGGASRGKCLMGASARSIRCLDDALADLEECHDLLFGSNCSSTSRMKFSQSMFEACNTAVDDAITVCGLKGTLEHTVCLLPGGDWINRQIKRVFY